MLDYTASFGILDIMVVLFYLALVVGIGFWTARGQGSNRDYFLGGRNLPWWVVGLSIIATETSALTFIGVPEMTIGALRFANSDEIVMTGGNMFFILLIVGYIIGRVIIAAWVVPYYFTGDVYTPYQLLTRAFGKGSRYAAGFLSFVGLTTGAGVRVYVTAIPVMIVFRVYFPEWNIYWSIFIIMGAALLYTAVGGIKAVVWTDMVQFFIFLIGGLFAVIYIPTLLTGAYAAPSGAEGWAAVGEVAGGDGVLDWWNFGLLTWTGMADRLGVSTGELTVGMYLWENVRVLLAGDFSILMGLIPVSIGIIFSFGFDQLNVQRVLGCKNTKEGRKAVLLSAILILPLFLVFLLVGANLYVFYQLNGMNFGDIMPWDPRSVDPETGIGTLNGSFVFPIFIMQHTPVFMKGLLVAAILAAAMSSVSSALSAMSSILVMDFYRPLAGSSSTRAMELILSRSTTVIAGILLTLVAIITAGRDDLLGLAFTVAGLTAGGILGAFLYGMIYKRGHSGPVVTGMIVSFIVMTIFWQARVNGWVWNVNWPWHTFIGAVICFGIIWVGHLFLPKDMTKDMRNAHDSENEPDSAAG